MTKRPRLTAAQRRLAETQIATAEYLARAAARANRQLDADECRSEAYCGLVAAALAFEAGHGCQFPTYARHKIQSRLMDLRRATLRNLGWIRTNGNWRHAYVQVAWPMDAEGEMAMPSSDPSPDVLAVRAEQWRLVRLTAQDRRDVALLDGLIAGYRQEELGERLGVGASRVSQLTAALVGPARQAVQAMNV